MPVMAVRSLIEAHGEFDRQEDRRLLVAVRIATNGTKEAVEDFMKDDVRPRMSLQEALALARQQQVENDPGTDAQAEG